MLGVQQAAVVSVFSIKLIAPGSKLTLTTNLIYKAMHGGCVCIDTNVVAAGEASSIIQQKSVRLVCERESPNANAGVAIKEWLRGGEGRDKISACNLTDQLIFPLIHTSVRRAERSGV